MKIVVFGGSGRIGSAVAWDLARDPEIEEIGLVDRRPDALERTRAWLGSERVVCHVLDVADAAACRTVMARYDAGALALPDRRSNYRVVEHAIDVGLSIVDMLEEYHRRPDVHETEGLAVPDGMTLEQYGESLHVRAMEHGVTLLDGMGFAPGLSNITVAEGIRKLDRAEGAVARVGGIPEKSAAQSHPLRYMITWAFEHVLREYAVRLPVRRDGRDVEVEAGSDRESFRFTQFGRDELLECAITPGMPSFLHTRPELRDFAEKTVRWPGHWEGVQTLKECGLLDLAPVRFDGREVVPREFLLATITPRLAARPGERDACVMYNTVHGTRGGKPARVEHFLWDEGQPEQGISAMMRVTGFPVAIAARLIARGEIRHAGIVPPEDGIVGELYPKFLAELERRGIGIAEVVSAG
ncbi:MAG TPA: saccharopine dehydrogenase C-terminal domain-containing protein [Candidatus Polarisedimenticolaceae bacterium]|nr:saccharopine dehydrogenase C-terminal domain-containing protein [Candidatus Polarisedimenticolaceae bacterium]